MTDIAFAEDGVSLKVTIEQFSALGLALYHLASGAGPVVRPDGVAFFPTDHAREVSGNFSNDIVAAFEAKAASEAAFGKTVSTDA